MQGVPPQRAEASTRDLRLKPRLIVNTGEGKGKTTAAFGMGLRAWNQGWSIGVFQFIKSGKWHVGEEAAYRALNQLHLDTGAGGPITWEIMGTGWTWLRSTASSDPAERAREGWSHVAELIANGAHQFYILDEFTYCLDNGWIDLDEVLAVLAARPLGHVVITGRRAPQALLDACDLATSMQVITHPFERGEKGQAGIEW
ncbi:MAG: cob(I)yrinic acid a,c-diamide adenosyltransferase [Propionibacteriaceae bacterium]